MNPAPPQEVLQWQIRSHQNSCPDTEVSFQVPLPEIFGHCLVQMQIWILLPEVIIFEPIRDRFLDTVGLRIDEEGVSRYPWIDLG